MDRTMELHKVVSMCSKWSDSRVQCLIDELEKLLHEREIDAIIQEHNEEAKAAAVAVVKMSGVTYQLELVSCGKCKRCGKGPAHGPYWYAYWSEGGKTRSRYIGKTFKQLARPGADSGEE